MQDDTKTPKPPEDSDSPSQAQQDAGAEQPKATDQPEAAQPTVAGPEISKDARMWAMFCHLGGLAGLIAPVVGNIVAPLIIWQVKKEDFPFADEQGREAVNFQISMSLYGAVGSAVCLVTCIGAVLIPLIAGVVYIVDLVFLLIAAVKANNGQHYRYPLTIRFIK
jgi:uncharacterized Tic20 family protein